VKATVPRPERLLIAVLAAWLLIGRDQLATAQPTMTEEERLQILTDPEGLTKKLMKDKNEPPFEFFKSQVAPFDVLPYVKPNHWFSLTFELRANEDDYDGFLLTEPVRLLGMPQEVLFRREIRLLKGQRARRGLQAIKPAADGQIPKQLEVELVRPGALRAEKTWQANLLTLPAHQMLVVVLSKDATTKFTAWNRMSAVLPSSAERDGGEIDKIRYYCMVLPQEPGASLLSSHPLTWTTISHVVWDNYPTDSLSIAQQQAMLDWLHWGGQLVISGGAGASYGLYRDSFLGPYLPAEATGENVALSQKDLEPLSESYPPPRYITSADPEPNRVRPRTQDPGRRGGVSYQAPVPIRPASNHPIYLSVLEPKPGASTITLGEASPRRLAVESRVGRGRITMLAINPNEESLLAWPGLDTLVRRVILRRPEDPVVGLDVTDPEHVNSPLAGRLFGPDLTWYRITSRDAGVHTPLPAEKPTKPDQETVKAPDTKAAATDADGIVSLLSQVQGVADWRDSALLPRLSRDLLEEASGITIPSSLFVLRVILAYLIVVVPLNWLVCRFVLRRPEWAWIAVVLVAFAFAIGVERVAARDMGYDTAADEIDLLELHGDYPRAHLTRLFSLYTSGRSRFSISYPDNPTALALPLDNGRSIRGEDVSKSTFQTSPVPGLMNFLVQPRSLAMFRAEEMLTLAGALHIVEEGGKRKIVNETQLELRDAILIDSAAAGDQNERSLGTMAPGASIEIDAHKSEAPVAKVIAGPGPDPNPFLEALRGAWEHREEEQGELRLVAWLPAPIKGQVIEPAIDRQRGFTAVLVHLRNGPPPSPDGRRYNRLANRNANRSGTTRPPKTLPSPTKRAEPTAPRKAGREPVHDSLAQTKTGPRANPARTEADGS
jgi:hypothetical protein